MIAGPLLDEVYSEVKGRTDQYISALPLLNIITDESSNVNNARISNVSVHSDPDVLHYISEDIRAMQMTATGSAQWLRTHLLNVANNDPTRLNSLTTDTCSTMFCMWGEIEKFPDFRHIFFIPCDSHGVQLLLKDLLKITTAIGKDSSTSSVSCHRIQKSSLAICTSSRDPTRVLRISSKSHHIGDYTLGNTVSTCELCSQEQRCTKAIRMRL
jgi:hypothetical protein